MFHFEIPIGGRSDDLAKKVRIENLSSGIVKSHKRLNWRTAQGSVRFVFAQIRVTE